MKKRDLFPMSKMRIKFNEGILFVSIENFRIPEMLQCAIDLMFIFDKYCALGPNNNVSFWLRPTLVKYWFLICQK